MLIKKQLQKTVLFLLALIPAGRGKYLFSTRFNKMNRNGPGRFLNNLEKGLQVQGIRLERFLLARCPAALIISYAPGDFFFTLCKRKKIKTVLRLDGFYPPPLFDNQDHEHRSTRFMDREKIFQNQQMQNALHLSDYVVYQSQFSKELADTYLYHRADNFRIVHNGVNTSHFHNPFPAAQTEITIMMLGSWRDPDVMACSLEAFCLFRKNSLGRLKIIGDTSPAVKKTIADWLERHQALAKQIDLRGEVPFERLPAEIAACQVSLHLKSGDWCPNAVLEALSCGVPVICQKWGGTAELVGEAGLVIEHEPYVYDNCLSEKAAAGITHILGRSTDLQRIARARVERHFAMEDCVAKYLDILNSDGAYRQ